MRESYFEPLLPAIVRFCRTFPPLCSKATSILVALSRASSTGEGGVDGNMWKGAEGLKVFEVGGLEGRKLEAGRARAGWKADHHERFLTALQRTFQELVETAVVKF